MSEAIHSRGPDDSGTWIDSDVGMALGHRRLSILDLSQAGHQPMTSPSGRYVIAFNGEIYNHLDIRVELEKNSAAPVWQGHSDTETLLASIDQWGLETALKISVGMFAIAVWDTLDRTLYLARDRFGEKPLYYGWSNGILIFGSELKALRAFPGFANKISNAALAQYFRFMYVPSPYSIYEGVYKLPPGSVLRVSGIPPSVPPAKPLEAPSNYGTVSLHQWWSLADVVAAGARNLISDEGEAINALELRLSDAVRLQSLADVPLGAFLSGGVDSSVVAALMQNQSRRPIKTFTVGFDESEFDESEYGNAIAKHLGTDHTVLRVTSRESQQAIQQLPAIYDEPFADSSQIPTFLMCRAARQHVTVALSGDGGDELFGGYNRYFWGPRLWRRFAPVPYAGRQVIANALTAISPSTWNRLGSVYNIMHRGNSGITRLGEKAHKLGSRLRDARNIDQFYLRLISEWQSPAALIKDSTGIESCAIDFLNESLPVFGVEDERLRFMFRDSLTYLPDDILCKVDRAAMAVSLETRVPFLDHRVAELAWRLPVSMKIRKNVGKWALRQVLYKHVPRELIDRPKSGFAIPLGQWLRGPLRAWADNLIDESRLEREGYLNSALIRETWQQHLSGRHDWTAKLWSVLMFQVWLEDSVASSVRLS